MNNNLDFFPMLLRLKFASYISIIESDQEPLEIKQKCLNSLYYLSQVLMQKVTNEDLKILFQQLALLSEKVYRCENDKEILCDYLRSLQCQGYFIYDCSQQKYALSFAEKSEVTIGNQDSNDIIIGGISWVVVKYDDKNQKFFIRESPSTQVNFMMDMGTEVTILEEDSLFCIGINTVRVIPSHSDIRVKINDEPNIFCNSVNVFKKFTGFEVGKIEGYWRLRSLGSNIFRFLHTQMSINQKCDSPIYELNSAFGVKKFMFRIIKV